MGADCERNKERQTKEPCGKVGDVSNVKYLYDYGSDANLSMRGARAAIHKARSGTVRGAEIEDNGHTEFCGSSR